MNENIVMMPREHWVSALDAVREKTNTSDLILSSELADKIDSISSGAGDESILNSIIDRTVTAIKSNALKVGANAFQGCTSLKNAEFPLATSVGQNAFYTCSAMTNILFPELATIDSYGFRGCAKLTELHFPKVEKIAAQAFQNCNALTKVRLDKAVTLNNLTFGQCGKLDTLILTSTEAMSTLANTTALSGTAIAAGTGYIYVPIGYLSGYKHDTNWVIYENQFRAIEYYPEILDGGVEI